MLKDKEVMIGISLFLKFKNSFIDLKLLGDNEKINLLTKLSIRFPELFSMNKQGFSLNTDYLLSLFNSFSSKDMNNAEELFQLLLNLYPLNASTLMDLFSFIIAYRFS